MRPSLIDQLLWIAGPALQIAVLTALYRRGLIAKYPSLAAYLFFWVSAFSIQYVLYGMGFYQAYYFAYWGCSAISVVITIVVITEILVHKVKGSPRKATRPVAILGCLISAIIFVRLDFSGSLTSVIMNANFEGRIIEAALLATFFVLCISKNEVRGLDFDIAFGFSAVVVSELLNHFMVNLHKGMESKGSYAIIGSSILAAVVWLRGAISHPEFGELDLSKVLRTALKDSSHTEFVEISHYPAVEASSKPPKAKAKKQVTRKLTTARYELTEQLGVGGWGSVHKARDHERDRWVALKILNHMSGNKPDIVRRFKREALIAQKLRHRNICKVYELYETPNSIAIAMELIQGKGLDRYVVEGRTRKQIGELITIFLQVAEALHYAHSNGVLHRDIKPSNVMIQPDGKVKVIDFGLAKLINVEMSTLTGNQPLGTAAFFAPELVVGQPATVQSDIYAFGCTMYMLLTGRHPYVGLNRHMRLEELIVDNRYTSPSIVNPNVHTELDFIVHFAMNKDLGQRYESAARLAADLKKLTPQRKNAA